MTRHPVDRRVYGNDKSNGEECSVTDPVAGCSLRLVSLTNGFTGSVSYGVVIRPLSSCTTHMHAYNANTYLNTRTHLRNAEREMVERLQKREARKKIICDR